MRSKCVRDVRPLAAVRKVTLALVVEASLKLNVEPKVERIKYRTGPSNSFDQPELPGVKRRRIESINWIPPQYF